MRKLDVFEPAMCCPTGICGVNVDPLLVQFNADLQWLAGQGIDVRRHSLGHDAAAFAADPDVVAEMSAGMDRLPITKIDGRVCSAGVYPTRAQLMHKLGMAGAASAKPDIKIAACGCKPGEC